MAAVDYPEMMALVESGKLDPSVLIKREIGLGEGALALASFDTSPASGITIIKPWG
jgi:alcohol dehydrogenase